MPVLVTFKCVSGIHQLRFLPLDFGSFNVKSAMQLQFNLKATLNSQLSQHTLLSPVLCLIIIFIHKQRETHRNDAVEGSFEHYKITLDNKNSAAFFFISSQ